MQGSRPASGLGSLSTQYDTALEASGLFWDDPRTSTPGTAYKYSTHGYTLLGAAIEGATGTPIADVLANLLGSGLGLSDLRAEDRSVEDEFRSEVFNNDNTVATADNISWKLLGGGMECSVEDMALFCEKLMGGEILSPAGLDTLWIRPDTLWTYAMGWKSDSLAIISKKITKQSKMVTFAIHHHPLSIFTQSALKVVAPSCFFIKCSVVYLSKSITRAARGRQQIIVTKNSTILIYQCFISQINCFCTHLPPSVKLHEIRAGKGNS